MHLLHKPWFFSLIVISQIAGGVGSFLFYWILRLITQPKDESIWTREFFYTGVLTGVVERFFFTSIIGLFGTGGIAQAVVTWIAVKGQLHYQIFNGTKDGKPQDLPRIYLSALGSMGSLAIAILAGHLWQQKWSLDTWRDHLAAIFF